MMAFLCWLLAEAKADNTHLSGMMIRLCLSFCLKQKILCLKVAAAEKFLCGDFFLSFSSISQRLCTYYHLPEKKQSTSFK